MDDRGMWISMSTNLGWFTKRVHGHTVILSQKMWRSQRLEEPQNLCLKGKWLLYEGLGNLEV